MSPLGPGELLRRARSYRRLFLSTFASGIGTWLAVIALSVDVFDRTGSAKWVSALLIADFLPAVVIGLFLGPVVDRVSRKLLMVGADIVRCAVFVALPFTDSPGRIVALAAVAGLATGFFRPAAYAGLPNLVNEADLPTANSLLRASEYATTTAGTFAGGILAATWGPHPAYWVNAGSFLVSALFLARISRKRLQRGRVQSKGHVRDIRDGFAVVRQSRALLTVFVSWNLIMITNGLINVAEIALAKISFSAGDFGFGLLWTTSGAGLVVGSLLAGRVLRNRAVVGVYTTALALMAFGAGTAAASPNVWVAAACMSLLGAGNGTAIVVNSLLVQRGAPDSLRGRAFTVIMSANFAVLGGAMVVAGPVTDRFGSRWAFAAAAVAAAVATCAGHALARGLRQPAEDRQTAPVLG